MNVKTNLFILVLVASSIVVSCSVNPAGNSVNSSLNSYERKLDENLEGTEIENGSTFYNNKYTISEVTLKGAQPGKYVFDTDGSAGSKVKMHCNGSLVMEIAYLWRTTITDKPNCYYTFSFPGYMDITVRATRGSINLYGIYKMFNGQNFVNVTNNNAVEIAIGSTFYEDKYTVVNVVPYGELAGHYTFSCEGNTGNIIKLYINGQHEQNLIYNWRTKVTEYPAGFYTFDFPGKIEITIRATRGSLNLYGLPAMFNRTNYVNVE